MKFSSLVCIPHTSNDASTNLYEHINGLTVFCHPSGSGPRSVTFDLKKRKSWKKYIFEIRYVLLAYFVSNKKFWSHFFLLIMLRIYFIVHYVQKFNWSFFQLFFIQVKWLQMKFLSIIFRTKITIARIQSRIYSTLTFSVSPRLSSNLVLIVTFNFGTNEHCKRGEVKWQWRVRLLIAIGYYIRNFTVYSEMIPMNDK